MILLTVSVSSAILTAIGGKCVSLQGEPAVGVLVTLTAVTCDPNDPGQTNWVANVVGKHGESDVYTYCIQGTNLCHGYAKDGETYREFHELVIADPNSLAQQWISLPEMPENFINLGLNLCDEAVGGFIVARECQDIPAQTWVDYDYDM